MMTSHSRLDPPNSAGHTLVLKPALDLDELPAVAVDTGRIQPLLPYGLRFNRLLPYRDETLLDPQFPFDQGPIPWTLELEIQYLQFHPSVWDLLEAGDEMDRRSRDAVLAELWRAEESEESSAGERYDKLQNAFDRVCMRRHDRWHRIYGESVRKPPGFIARRLVAPILTSRIAQACTTFASGSTNKKRLHTLNGPRQKCRHPSHQVALSSSPTRRCFPVRLLSSPSCSTSLTVPLIATTVWPFVKPDPSPSRAPKVTRITHLNIQQYKLPDYKTAASQQAHDQTFLSAPKKDDRTAFERCNTPSAEDASKPSIELGQAAVSGTLGRRCQHTSTP